MRNINGANLMKKRKELDKLEKYFPVSRATQINKTKTGSFKGEWIIVPESRSDKVVLYVHGGGFVFYPKLYRDLISRIAKAGEVKALSIDYSLSPEHKFPTALNELIAAYKWLLQDYAPASIAVAGDSAGGALVLSLLHSLRDMKLPNPACVAVISPATDATLKSTSMRTNKNKDFFIKKESLDYLIPAYFGDTPTDHPIASPLHGSFEGFPPLLVHAEKHEIMYDDSSRLVEKAQKANVDVYYYETEGLWHVYHLYARYVPEARAAIKNIGSFIQANLKS